MEVKPVRNVLAAGVAVALKQGLSFSDAYVHDDLNINLGGEWNYNVHLENCVFEGFSAAMTSFEKSVRLVNCRFIKCDFNSTYFLGGLIIDNCTFENSLDFSSGGHNKNGNLISITRSEFKGFVNFFDCWFEYDLTVCQNTFHAGTNLLGNPHGIPVTFDGVTIFQDNTGKLDFNDEQ